MNLIIRFIIICFLLMWATPLKAHNSTCHMWHSCPPDSGSYICGGLGLCSQCPDNEFCKNGKPIKPEEPDPGAKPKPGSSQTFHPSPGLEEVYIVSSPKKPQEIHVKSTPKKSKNSVKRESYYRNSMCSKWKGTSQYALDDGTRVDCLTDKYAVEFAFSYRWAEAVGQTLHYSMKTGKKAGIVLIMNENNSQASLEKMKDLIGHYRLDIKIWILKIK
jgi:hypothetical protein